MAVELLRMRLRHAVGGTEVRHAHRRRAGFRRPVFSLAKLTREHLAKHRDAYPHFDSLSRQIRDFSEESDALGVLDDKGNLYDSASPELAEIRRELETLRRQIRRSAQNILDNPSLAHMLQERVTAFRNGHFVFLVRQEFVNRFPGTVVDRSGSGSSVYMEPSALVPLNNRLAMKIRDEKEEERPSSGGSHR